MPKVIGEKKTRIHNQIQKQGKFGSLLKIDVIHSLVPIVPVIGAAPQQVLCSTKISVSTFSRIRWWSQACWKNRPSVAQMWCWKLVPALATWRWKYWKKWRRSLPAKSIRDSWPNYRNVCRAHRIKRNCRYSSAMPSKRNSHSSTFASRTCRTKSVRRWYSNCCCIGRSFDAPFSCSNGNLRSDWSPNRATNSTVASASIHNCWPVSICWWKSAKIISSRRQRWNRRWCASSREIRRHQSTSPNGTDWRESHSCAKTKRWRPPLSNRLSCRRSTTITNWMLRSRIRCVPHLVSPQNWFRITDN